MPAPPPPAPETSAPPPAQTTTGGTGPVTGSTTGSSAWTGTGPSTGRRTGTGGSGASSSWANLKDADANAAPLAPGDTIKDRFVLEDIIGKGGMGIVFKARDLRWEEAQDRNPYVAVKVLNEDFKRHPESLKALQRESRKAQNLAHPNVVTVYQFDRDGANVFMVMELLEGEPLDRLIKRNDGSGLPPKTALKYTAHMARALAYAHEQGIVHSDFKPANAYMTRDGIVKVFDFGISRAAKRSDKVSGSMTLFDPGTLGALTPAYASCEMIEGLEPDPRDDIYALACVFYELLTGRHPFDKKSAVQARDAKMVPAPIPGLSRKQWRGLLRGLAFNREQRSKAVMDFLNDVSPTRRSPGRWVGAAAAVVIVAVGVALFMPGYLEKRRVQAIAEVIRRGDDKAMPDALKKLDQLTPEQRATVLLTDEARNSVLSYFERQADAATDASKQKYDFARAFALLDQAEKTIPGLARVADRRKALEGRQAELLNQLSDRFDKALANGWLIDKQNPENASRILESVAKVQPNNALLTTDRRLQIAYADQAKAALDRSNVELAEELIAAGLKLAPQDAGLKDLHDRVALAASNLQSQQHVRTLRASIDSALGASPSLDAFDRKRSELVELRAVAPNDSSLERWQRQLEALLDRRLQELGNARSYIDAEALLGRYAELASANYVADRRDSLTGARKQFSDELTRLSESLQAAIHAGRLGPPAANNAQAIYQNLQRSGASPEQLAIAKEQIAGGYLALARDLRGKGAFADARKQVDAGLALQPSTESAGILRDEKKEIDESEQLAKSAADAQQRQQLAAQRAKEDADLKAQLATALKAPRQTMDTARAALALADKLQSRGVTDPLVKNARRDIQNQLLVEIRSTIDKSGPDAAMQLAQQASALLPESTELGSVMAEIRKVSADRQAQARTAAITAVKTDMDALVKAPKLDEKWYRDVTSQLRRVSVYLPDSDPYVVGAKRNVSNAYIAAARTSRAAKSLSEADRMLDRAAEFTPNHPDLTNERKLVADARALQEKASQQAKAAADIDAMKQRLVTQAKNDNPEFLATFKTLKDTLPANDPFLRDDAPFAIAESYIRQATKAARRGEFDTAIKLIDKGLENADGLRVLKELRTLYVSLQGLDEQIRSGSAVSGKDLKAAFDGLARRSDPSVYSDITQRFKRNLDARIRTESSRNPALAASFDSARQQAFPGEQPITAATRPSPTSVTPADTGKAPAAPAVSSQSAATPAPTATMPAPGQAPAAAAAASVATTAAAGGKPCRPDYAGKGIRTPAVCFDAVAGGKGPDLVVVPAGGPLSTPMAVMRYEATNQDYNFYCTSTGRCKTVSGGANLPIVAVGVADAEHYAAWLSEATGKVYRLPTSDEWSYIATGVPADPKFNCTVVVLGQQRAGYELMPKDNGEKTAWGIFNVLGNAQEWAKDRSGGWVARGGAFSDNASNCRVDFGRVQNGSADGKTGFRLIRDM